MYHWQPWSSQELIYHVVTLANYENIDLVVIYHKKNQFLPSSNKMVYFTVRHI